MHINNKKGQLHACVVVATADKRAHLLSSIPKIGLLLLLFQKLHVLGV
jgi:hypothetical protein